MSQVTINYFFNTTDLEIKSFPVPNFRGKLCPTILYCAMLLLYGTTFFFLFLCNCLAQETTTSPTTQPTILGTVNPDSIPMRGLTQITEDFITPSRPLLTVDAASTDSFRVNFNAVSLLRLISFAKTYAAQFPKFSPMMLPSYTLKRPIMVLPFDILSHPYITWNFIHWPSVQYSG